jgi:hypothetical protein
MLMVLLLLAGSAFSQRGTRTEPLILRGQLINSPEKILNIGFTDENGIRGAGYHQTDAEGKFYLKTYKIKNPQLSSIQQKPRRSTKYL